MNYYWYDDWGEIGNVGDRIAPITLRYLLGYEVKNCHPDATKKLLTEGSVIEFIQPGDIVWGSGLIEPMKLSYKDNVKIFMVRGPLTRDYLIKAGYEVPEIYGSGAFLLPDIFPDHQKIEYKTGIIPHYIDRDKIGHLQGHFIDVFSRPEDFINEVCKCEQIISSSLHGIIIAEAYGIPAKWVQLSNNIIGGDFKFRDYYNGTNREAIKDRFNNLPNINIKQIKDTWNATDVYCQQTYPM